MTRLAAEARAARTTLANAGLDLVRWVLETFSDNDSRHRSGRRRRG
jgi:hypothetical protein